MRKSKRRRERIVLWLIFGGAAVLALSAAALFGANKWYRHWQADRFARRAQTYLSWGDTKSATLTARQVLEFDPENLEAFRILADLSERQGSPAAIELRKKISNDHPDSVPDAVVLAKTALKFGAIETAESALRQVGERANKNSGCHEVLAQIAVAQKKYRDAEREFQRALQLDGSNLGLSLQLGAVQLHSSDANARDKGQKLLQALLNDTILRARAAKILLENAIEQKDPALIHFADLLFSYAETSFRDRLICVQLFSRLELPQFASALTALQDRATANTDDLTSLISWMSTNNLSFVALEWIKRLPPDMLTKRPVFVAVADCYAATKDCAGLQEWTKKGGWPTLEFLRHAYLARALRDCNDALNSELEWSRAVKAATEIGEVETLQRAAAKWGWKKESIELLWTLTNYPDKQKTALGTLYQYYADEGDTGSLYRVAARLARVAPDDLEVQNNFAQLSLLLNADVERARGLARQLYARNNRDANVLSTYAYALYTQGRYNDAANIMKGLNAEELKRPEIAAYYGVILSAIGERQKAREFFEISKTARLLPEEKRLVDEAVARQ